MPCLGSSTWQSRDSRLRHTEPGKYLLFEALLLACWYGRVEIATQLLDRGAPVDLLLAEEATYEEWRAGGKSRPQGAVISLSSWTPLSSAIAQGELEVVSLLLNRGARIDIPDARGDVAIHYASSPRVPRSSVNLVLAAGADVHARNHDGQTPIATATTNKRFYLNPTTIRDLLAAGADITEDGDYDGSIVLSMVTYGDDPIWRIALEFGLPLMPSVSPSELLLAASALGDKEIVQQLLEREDTDPHTVDLRNRSAPMLAAKQGHDDIIRMLLPHMATPMETWTDLFGLSMLDVAIRTENLSTVRLVTETTDALFNARDRHGDTPLVLASKQEPPSTALIQLLLEGGAEVEVIDDDGRSPLHHVTASGNNVEALRLLLDALPARSADEPPKELLTPCDCGITVDPEQRSIFWTWVHPTATDVKPRYGPVIDLMDDRGWTPLKLALHHGRTELAELLTSHGASPVEVTEKSEQNNFPIRFC